MKELGVNFFKIVKVKSLDQDFYRVTLFNEYVGTNDVDIIMTFEEEPKIDQRIMLIAYEV